MKKFIISVLLALFVCQATYAQNGNTDREYVNFRNVSMKEFVTFVQSYTKINMVYNEADLRGTVTISSQQQMSPSSLMEIFDSVLAANGLVAMREKDYVRILPEREIANYSETYTDRGSDGFVTTIITLESYNATALAATLTRVKSRNGHVEAIRGINGLLIRDFGDRIDKMRQIIRRMDRYVAEYKLYSITIENAIASKVEQQIIKFYNELMKNMLIGQIPMMLSDDFSNVLIISCTESDYEKIMYLVNELDKESVLDSTLPRVYYLKYAKAEDVEQVLNKILGSDAGTAGGTPPGGQAQGRPQNQVKSQVSFDKSTNAIIAIGTPELYFNLERLLEKLDIPRKQVWVEALILETSLDRGDVFGVEWFLGGAQGTDLFGLGSSKGSGAINSVVNPIASGTAPDLGGLPQGFSAGVVGDIVVFNGVSFPSLGAFMQAVRTDSGVNIVSNPQVLTVDNTEAEVFVGENRPFLTLQRHDSDGDAINSFEYRDVGIRLKVTPHIIGDDRIHLEIEQEVNKLAPSSSPDTTTPITLNRTTKTQVQLYNRSIMVISGLMKDDSTVSVQGIPGLSSIPLLGWLFKTQSTTSEKTNLMVFLTAYIVDTEEDMETLLKRRTMGTASFNREIQGIITNKIIRKHEDSFIPMQEEVYQISETIINEEAAQ